VKVAVRGIVRESDIQQQVHKGKALAFRDNFLAAYRRKSTFDPSSRHEAISSMLASEILGSNTTVFVRANPIWSGGA
jgi:hypothetical protein